VTDGGVEPGGEFGGATSDVFEVEDALGEAAEEAWHAALEDVASWREDGGIGIEHAREREEVVLAASGSVEHEECARACGGGGDEDVLVDGG
jgi:hypothetical protein